MSRGRPLVPYRWRYLPVLVVVVLVLVGGSWAINGAAQRYGARFDAEVLRTGTAEIHDCRRAASTFFLGYRCDADVVLDQPAGEVPRDTRALGVPDTVWSRLALTGDHAVVTVRQLRATRRGDHREVVVTLDHPAGTSRGWVVGAWALMIVLPVGIGIGTHRVLVRAGVVPSSTAPRDR